MYEEHLSAECRINKGFLEKFNIAIFAVPSKSSLIFTSFFKLLKYIRTGIEVVITGLTRNQFVGNTGTWVRIPPRPPITRFLLRAKTLFFYEFPQKFPHQHPARLTAPDNADNDDTFDVASRCEYVFAVVEKSL